MKTIFENVIQSGRYELADMLRKIDAQWIQGGLTDEQRAELANQARGRATPGNSVDVLAKLNELEGRIRALEGTQSGAEEGEPEEYCAGKWYYAGDRVTFEGAVYVCAAPAGVVCTWSPKEYPDYWDRS